jgi:hypothetical protein
MMQILTFRNESAERTEGENAARYERNKAFKLAYRCLTIRPVSAFIGYSRTSSLPLIAMPLSQPTRSGSAIESYRPSHLNIAGGFSIFAILA